MLEIGAGDLAAARNRIAVVQDIPKLDLTRGCSLLADELLERAILPKKARLDALHIAIAAMNGIDFLVTWNCSHIANALLIPRIASIITARGFQIPLICTPPQL